MVAQKLCQALPNIIVIRCTEQWAPHVVVARHFLIRGGRVVASICVCHVECKRHSTESEPLANRGVGATWVRHDERSTDVFVRVRSVPAHHGTGTRVTKQIETQRAKCIGRPFHFSVRPFSIKKDLPAIIDVAPTSCFIDHPCDFFSFFFFFFPYISKGEKYATSNPWTVASNVRTDVLFHIRVFPKPRPQLRNKTRIIPRTSPDLNLMLECSPQSLFRESHL